MREKAFFVMILVSCVLYTSSILSATEDWTLTTTFTPTETEILGIPVKAIDRTLKRVLILRYEILPEPGKKDFARWAHKRFHFERVGDFNADGNMDKALVGVYEDGSGQFGRMLLILTNKESGKWTKYYIVKWPDKPGFSVLFGKKNRLQWGDCMECDSAWMVVWSAERYTLVEGYYPDY
ncbi:MAG: hypothetical protein ACYTGS_09535 [Planctomycetota bacterium]|jgi:hypothetical protein